MSGLTVVIIFIIGVFALAYKQASLKNTALASGILLLVYLLFGDGHWVWSVLLLLSTVLTGLLSIDEFRRNNITTPAFRWYKDVLPHLSETEQEAIDAGTVWWEGDLFAGNPDWEKLLSMGKPGLNTREQNFIDGPLEDLCRMVDSWKINFESADMSEELVEFIKQNKFLGLIIHKEYGGLELSAVAQVQVMTKLFGVSSVVANFISVPNSLGPGELLQKYGTEEQKNYYLPRLASGQEVPCFALTGPTVGSDATSLPDTGVVCKGQWQGQEIIGMRLNFDKRYITLSPIATLIGLAFRLQDPDHLIGDVEDYGITCALIPGDIEGLEIGARHYPMGDPFHNGPIRGQNIFVPLETIIGGQEMAGKGWRMLVNCLSVGRAISLPSISNCLGKRALAGTSAYARIRRQFNLPIARFEGVQKPLARIAGLSYIINAACLHTAQAIDDGAKPAVASSILKYHCTEMGRQMSLDAADIHGGKGVMKGPKNYLSSAYESVPVAITVEGANIMTRSLMIFGQGATRCHPFVLKEMTIAQQEVTKASVAEFDEVLFGHIGYTCRNGAYSFIHALTGSLFTNVLIDSPVKVYYQHLSRLSAAFALVTDAAMIVMQGSLKRREMISGRLGDLLSMLFLASLVLKHYEDDACPLEDLPLVEWACQYLLNRYQIAMDELLQNFPSRLLAFKLRYMIFPLGKRFNPPSDALDIRVSELVTEDTATRNRLVAGSYLAPLESNPLGVVDDVFREACDMTGVEEKLADAVKSGKLEALNGPALAEAALVAGILHKEEAQRYIDHDKRVMAVINVDEFLYDSFDRNTSQIKKPVAAKTVAKKAVSKKKTARKKAAKKKVSKPQTKRAKSEIDE